MLYPTELEFLTMDLDDVIDPMDVNVIDPMEAWNERRATEYDEELDQWIAYLAECDSQEELWNLKRQLG